MVPILLLSPMPHLAERASRIAAELGIDLIAETTYDDASAIAAIERHPATDVVVTRGGLVEGVKHIPNISVVGISLSTNELLGYLDKLTAQGFRRVGIVSRENLIDGAIGDFQIIGLEVCIRSCLNEESIKATVGELVQRGFEAFIGCRMSCQAAQSHGMPNIFLDSGDFSIRSALQEARRIQQARQRERLQAAQLKAIIDNIEEGVVAISRENDVVFLNEPARRICGADLAVDCQALTAPFKQRSAEQVIAINGQQIIARRIALGLEGQKQGDVITFQEVSRIQASETKIRMSSYKKGLYAKHTFDDIVAQTEVMRALIAKAKAYAEFDANLLIYGETGTGKEIFAQSIHNHSRYRNGPFVSVNTASIAPSLMESELFGYVDGAFTGARKGGKAGLFELAHRGTIFLDEIGELPPEMQSRLLRVLQEKEIMRIGDDKIVPIDVRVISATNRNLFELAQQERFRQDLYYRVHVLGVRIPPLRLRVDDIPLLFQFFLDHFGAVAGQKFSLTPAAIALLKSYSWPGNIRQLRNVAEVVSCGGVARIDAEQLGEVLDDQGQLEPPGSSAETIDGVTLPESLTLKQLESRFIKHMMARYTPEEVCSRLGISRVTLWRKLGYAAAADAALARP
jgi:transcriptional regulator with PAS, ATPase and Fis domain